MDPNRVPEASAGLQLFYEGACHDSGGTHGLHQKDRANCQHIPHPFRPLNVLGFSIAWRVGLHKNGRMPFDPGKAKGPLGRRPFYLCVVCVLGGRKLIAGIGLGGPFA